MRNKRLFITTLIFFLIINTTYYWEGKLGILAFPASLILIIVFIILLILLFGQIFLFIKEKFKDKQRLALILLMLVVLLLTVYRPWGIIDFDKLEGKDILIAEGEGAANCKTTFKLKENNKFIDHTICFGVSDIKGRYTIKGDTIFFYKVHLNISDKEYYKFALLENKKSDKNNELGYLIRCMDYSDTSKYGLKIIKNELKK